MTFTPERMAERRKGIGASEVPAIVGLSPWATPMDVWLSKQEGHTPEPETEAQRNGHRMEGPILEALSADIGLPVTRNDQIVWGKGRLFCTPDGYVVGRNIIAQAKWVGPGSRDKWGQPGEDWQTAVPDYVQAQVMAEMAVTHADACYVATAMQGYAGIEWNHWLVSRDDEWCEQIIDTATEWYERHVIGNTPPEGTTLDRANYTLARLRNNGAGPKRERDAEAEEAVRAYIKAKAIEKAGKQAAKAAQAHMLAMLGENTGGVEGLFAVNTQKGRVRYGEAIKALCPGADLEPFRGAPSARITLARNLSETLQLSAEETKALEDSDE